MGQAVLCGVTRRDLRIGIAIRSLRRVPPGIQCKAASAQLRWAGASPRMPGDSECEEQVAGLDSDSEEAAWARIPSRSSS